MSEQLVFDSRCSRARLAVTLAIATIGNVGMWAVVVIMPAVQAEFGVSRFDSSSPYTLTILGFALGNLVIGQAVDRCGVTHALIGASLLSGLGLCVAMAMPQVHLVSLCVDRGFGPAAGAKMFSLMLQGGVVSRLVSGLLASKLGV